MNASTVNRMPSLARSATTFEDLPTEIRQYILDLAIPKTSITKIDGIEMVFLEWVPRWMEGLTRVARHWPDLVRPTFHRRVIIYLEKHYGLERYGIRRQRDHLTERRLEEIEQSRKADRDSEEIHVKV
ncbi:uncharacterized protein AB675_7499 [Cyphellophora attinorum]|uniref:Uncharacterized protein n=1 Tax=Cyphellophora attinorum TaxID=1664694 RepID=A0A0N1NYK7_9EURO|nr:uncharacterized protein AB675_7499 [Phialophora attinorum]KPI40330.1 hypothetical protein AB675_7499 [Phialophora attinorum]